jgi:hypothetical protein
MYDDEVCSRKNAIPQEEQNAEQEEKQKKQRRVKKGNRGRKKIQEKQGKAIPESV